MSQPGRVRVLAICVCRYKGKILVFEGCDEAKNNLFYRPLGGTVEFGETGAQAVQREFQEEIGCALTGVRFLGVLENIYTYQGKMGHEVVLVYDGILVNAALYEQPVFSGDELGTPMKVLWVALTGRTPASPPIYPAGLLELLERAG